MTTEFFTNKDKEILESHGVNIEEDIPIFLKELKTYFETIWEKKYIDELDSPVSIDDYQDYLSNYEALLTTIEEDGVATEDLFGFDFLDDA